MVSLLLPNKPADMRKRDYIAEKLFGMEFPPRDRSACCSAAGAVASSCGNQEEAPRAEQFGICGWCGCTRGCDCEEGIAGCASGGCFFEKLQLDGTAGEPSDLEGDCYTEASQETLSVIDGGRSSCGASESSASEDTGLVESWGDAGLHTQPDFSGRWVFRRYDGDFDAMMEDGGTHWTIRKLARAANYGVGMISQDINQQGDHMIVDFNAGASVNRMEFRVGEAGQATLNEGGEQTIISAAWEGSAISVAGIRSSNGSKLQDTLWYMQGHELVVQTRLSSGIVVRRFYAQ